MKQLKIGVFGLWRGGSFLSIINSLDNAVVTAVCDKDESKVAEALSICPEAKVCADFDELLDSGIEAVLLCNYFHQHASYAIAAMKRGIHVFSVSNQSSIVESTVDWSIQPKNKSVGCKLRGQVWDGPRCSHRY